MYCTFYEAVSGVYGDSSLDGEGEFTLAEAYAYNFDYEKGEEDTEENTLFLKEALDLLDPTATITLDETKLSEEHELDMEGHLYISFSDGSIATVTFKDGYITVVPYERILNTQLLN